MQKIISFVCSTLTKIGKNLKIMLDFRIDKILKNLLFTCGFEFVTNSK